MEFSFVIALLCVFPLMAHESTSGQFSSPYTCTTTTTTTLCEPKKGIEVATSPGQGEMRRSRGEKGEKGESCQCNFADQDEVLQLRLELQNVQNRYQNMQTELEKLSGNREFASRLESMQGMIEKLRRGVCQTEYKGRCFWLIQTTVTSIQGKSLCNSFGGSGANIYDSSHYDMISDYIRSVMPVQPYIEPWTGMTTNQLNGDVMFANGSISTYMTWYPSFPVGATSHTEIGLTVRYDSRVPEHGMFNWPTDKTRHGVLCEI